MKVDLWTGKIIEEKPEVQPEEKEEKPEVQPEEKVEKLEIKEEDVRRLIEKGREMWGKFMEAVEAMRREAERRRIEKVLRGAEIPILPERKKGVMEELGIEKV